MIPPERAQEVSRFEPLWGRQVGRHVVVMPTPAVARDSNKRLRHQQWCSIARNIAIASVFFLVFERYPYRVLTSYLYSNIHCSKKNKNKNQRRTTRLERTLSLRPSTHRLHTTQRLCRNGTAHNTGWYTLLTATSIPRRGWFLAADAGRTDNAVVDKCGREPQLHVVSINLPFFHPGSSSSSPSLPLSSTCPSSFHTHFCVSPQKTFFRVGFFNVRSKKHHGCTGRAHDSV